MKKIMKKILIAVLSLAMIACFVPQTGMQVYAEDEVPAMVLGSESVLKDTANTDDAQTVWYAGKPWRVISFDGTGNEYTKPAGAMTLFSSDFLDKVSFNLNVEGEARNDYAGSNLQKTVDSLYSSLFGEKEKEAVIKRELSVDEFSTNYPGSTGVSGTATSGYLWPLSFAEALVLPSDTFRRADDVWALRSPGSHSSQESAVSAEGVVISLAVGPGYGVRPAFDFNLDSVLFTSAAEGGNSDAEGNLAAVGENATGEWKLTLLDDGTITGLAGHNNFTVSNVTPAENGVTVEYKNAATGTNEYISAIVTDKPITQAGAAIKYYGRIKNCTSANDATDTLTIDTVNKIRGNDKLYVFNEQYNGDKKTGFASALTEVTAPELFTYEITFEPNNGSEPVKKQTGTDWKLASIPEPEWEGGTLQGWYPNEDLSGDKITTSTVFSSNSTVYGSWDLNMYKVYFVSEGTVVLTVDAPYGSSVGKPTDDPPPITADAQYTYTFAGWDYDFENSRVTSNTTINAVFNRTLNEYNIEFVNEDGTVLQSGKVAYDDTPSYTGQTPTKKDDVKYTYTFAGWSPEIKAVTGDATYKATYTAKKKPAQPQPDPKPQPKINKAAAKIALDAGIIAKSSGSKVTASWGAVKGASSYVIYANYCDQKKLKKIRTVSGKTTSFDITKLNGKKFNPKKNLKFYVVAYKTVKGKKVKLAKSIMAHAPGSKNSKRTNVTGVKVKKASFTLKKGKTAKIKAKLVLQKKGKKPLKHCAKFRYASSNKKVAKVSKKGKITAVGKGKCTVYVYAVSGVSKKIKVTVK